jgi:hypothetical protein
MYLQKNGKLGKFEKRIDFLDSKMAARGRKQKASLL